MRKLGVFVVLFVFLSASEVLAAPNLLGCWDGHGELAMPSCSLIPSPGPPGPGGEKCFVTGYMHISIDHQQEAPGGAVFRGGNWTLSIEGKPSVSLGKLTGAISLTNAIKMTVSSQDTGETIAVLSGQYLGRAINVVFQDLTDQGLTGAFSLQVVEQEQGPPPGTSD